MSTETEDMADQQDNDERKGIACQGCGGTWLEYFSDHNGTRRWGYSKEFGRIRVRVRFCHHCGRRVTTHERIVG